MTNRDFLLNELAAGRYEETGTGLVIPRAGVRGVGIYDTSHNGGPWEQHKNTVTLEYLDHLLQSGMNGTAQISDWYMTLFGVGQTPEDTWTAASFAALGTENTDPAEGYVSATRPAVTFDPADGGVLDNAGTPVQFTFATTGGVTIGGIALLSSDNRGGSAGILVSASNLNQSRTFEDGDTYDVIYRLRFEAA